MEDGTAAPHVTDDMVAAALRNALQTVDLSTTTERQLRKDLEEKFGVDLTDRKGIIRTEVEKFLAEQEPIEESEDDEPAPKRRATGGGGGSVLSEAMQAFLGVESLARPQVVKQIWAYIKENDLQDPSNKRKIIVDEKLGTLFTPPIDMFSINKQISKHVKSIPGGGGGEKKPRERKPRKKPATEDGVEPKKAGGFTKAYRITPELGEWVGQPEISRPDLTRFFWHYVKLHELQDPADKRWILLDPKLQALTNGETRIQGFSHSKYLSHHFLKKGEAEGS